MGRRPSLALLIVVAGAFFLIGLYTAFLQDTPSEGPTTRPPTESPQATAAVAKETTLLFLGVDDLQSDVPQLEAVWFLSYQTSEPHAFLLGIPLDTTVEGDPPQTLRESFAFDPSSGPSEGFRSRLHQAVPLEPDATIVLDRIAFAAAIDFVGGVRLNDSSFTGQEVLGILSLTDDDPQAALALQGRLLNALSRSATSVGDTPELTPLVELEPQHLYLSTSVNHMVALVSPLLPIRPETTHIETY